MRLSPRKNSLDSLFKEVRVFKARVRNSIGSECVASCQFSPIEPFHLPCDHECV